jgi:hypothetical protein
MYEHHKQPLLSVRDFVRRVLGHFLLAMTTITVALFIGMAGYHYLDDLSWIDALVNASMLLGGMGPVDPLKNNAAKLFASFYALFSGLLFIGILGVLLAPFIHRLAHKMHLEGKAK